MVFSVKLASIGDKQVIRGLLQPYLEELSKLPGEDVDYRDEAGVYHYPYLDACWLEAERFPYLLYAKNNLAGFAMVRKDGDHWEMAEYYVVRRFRQRGVGKAAAAQILERHKGEWRIGFNKHNEPARALWIKLAASLAVGGVEQGEADAAHAYVRFSV